jgi:acetate kinase
VVAFDTDFHAHLAPWSRRLPIPADWAARGLRRYGFHGLAFASDLRQVGAVAPSILRGRAVLAHLGGGCSVCAVDGGRSVDTTMSATPTSGLPGPTRSGDLDPAVVLQMLRYDGGDAAAVAARLAHASGLAGIAGTGDLRALLAEDRADAVLAVDQFVMRTAQAIAAMATAIGGLEHLVFSGGSGHRSPVLRACIVRQLEWVGLALDADRNDSGAMLISAPMTPSIWNVDVDEELELALGACAALRAGRAASHPVRGL